MKQADSQGFIVRLTQRWQRRRLLGRALSVGAWAFLLAPPLRFWIGLEVLPSLGLSFLVWAIGFMFLFVLKPRAQPTELAEHLNRTVPELEESGALFLAPESSLPVMYQMQRRRLATVFDKLPSASLLPTRSGRRALVYFAVSLTLTSASVALIPEDTFQRDMIGDAELAATPGPATNRQLPVFQSARVRIEPPGYTGLKARYVDQLTLEVAEGSVVVWELAVNREIQRLTLVMSSGDSIALERTDQQRYTGRSQMWESSIYNFLLETASGTGSSEYFELRVRKDAPPSVVLLEPKQRTRIEPSQPRRTDVIVAVDDDHGIIDASIIATVSKGSGEGIKFREQTLTFNQRTAKTAGSYEYRRALDFDSLGMAPGDELYFFVEASDNREPTPNRGRSETYFIVLEDTATAVLLSDFGLGINPLPEYFRSQRQIIIDTEKLLQEKNRISVAEFKRRSNNLGIDQKALRLRYGQFLGEEADDFAIQSTDSSEPQPTQPDEELAFGHGRSQELRDPDEQEEAIPSDLMHEHDYEENATLFGESIKTQLKAALAEMWDAELHLRTFKTREALPFEYRALVLLKRVQQHARIYVKRIGFEPPPLEPDEKRLSGDLSNIESQSKTKVVGKEDPFHDIRAGLQIVRAWRRGQLAQGLAQTDALERAGEAMTRQALAQPGSYLRALNDLRTLIAGQANGDLPHCERCLTSIERAFWRLLPNRHPLPDQKHFEDSDLSRRYSKKLDRSL